MMFKLIHLLAAHLLTLNIKFDSVVLSYYIKVTEWFISAVAPTPMFFSTVFLSKYVRLALIHDLQQFESDVFTWILG